MSGRPARRRDVGVFDRSYGGTTGTLRTARNEVGAWLAAHGLNGDLRDRVALVLSELASNAVQASPGVPYGVRVSAVDGSVVVAVTSKTNSGRPPPKERWGPATLLATRGRGLLIVDELSDDVVVDLPVDDTVVVTATLR